MKNFRVALAQMNSFVGDLEGNKNKIISFIKESENKGCNVIAFPELAIVGYPPGDLLLKQHFINDNIACLKEIAKNCQNITAVVGFVDKKSSIYNSAAIIHGGAIKGVYNKLCLPDYEVFNERRYFQQGSEIPVFIIDGVPVGISIGDDICCPESPATVQALNGAEILININASPYYVEKWRSKRQMLSTRAADTGTYIMWVNLTGGQDDLVFDGDSIIINPKGEITAGAGFFKEDLLMADCDLSEPLRQRLHDPRCRSFKVTEFKNFYPVKTYEISTREKVIKKDKLKIESIHEPSLMEEIYSSLVTGTRDYIVKNNFKKAVVGISGGVDSALVVAIAADSIGKENVKAVFMPARYTSNESREISKKIAENLGIEFEEISIDGLFQKYLDTLSWDEHGMPQEKIQARIRTNILMAFSNKFKYLDLTTVNKSEMCVGFTSLYGDLGGGLNVLSDVYKKEVFALTRYRNTIKEVFPENLFTRPPTSELKDGVTDEAALGCTYAMLDPILIAYVEEDKSIEEILELGYPLETVKKIVRLVDTSEHKRRQAPPGIKITKRAFGVDRKFPITQGYR